MESIAYQKALFLYDLTWEDCDKLQHDARGRKVAAHVVFLDEVIALLITELSYQKQHLVKSR